MKTHSIAKGKIATGAHNLEVLAETARNGR